MAYIRLPGAVQLTVVPGDLRVPAGRPATIVAVAGRRGTLAHLGPQITLDANGHTVTLPMQAAGDGYEFRVARVDRSFHYMVSAGPAVSRAYSVTALHPARVERIIAIRLSLVHGTSASGSTATAATSTRRPARASG